MKRLALSASVLLAVLALAPAAQAQQTTTQKPTTPSKTTTTSQTTSAVEQDLRVFSNWVSDKLSRAESEVRRELPKISAEFDRQSQRIDKGVDSLSAQGKREYGDQKKRYKDWASKQDSLNTQARRPETAQQTQDRLLGEKVILSRARATELPDLYGRFIEATREQRRDWTATDWSNAAAVLANLNGRYEQVREQIPLESRIRIRSWQGEFRTLEAARDAKEVINK
ncbi:hypothetical protein MTX78_06050 [Hymenobacter tibetensis]|uniref:DUF3450 domain-containing protein n=1 Tax=Hymenobacter tibetensis TaxID=497967 RepID=A0ABY4D1H6_9BACT|nr:hypothetical protein [Hymenobacter tibetensis]UOG76156.1 hypothetical protein MTX78_06050 [Hymenobacter tibetensis]